MHGSPTDFWGKLHRSTETGPVTSWHPLEHHCADVAAVAEALLKHSLLGLRLARLAGFAQFNDVTIGRLSVLTALHDLGKFNNEFQNKAFPERAPTGGHVGPALDLLCSRGTWSERLWSALDATAFEGWADDSTTILALLDAAIGHHGKPVAPERGVDPGVHERRWRPANGLDPIRAIARMAKKLRVWFPEAWAPTDVMLPSVARFQHAFAGLVMLSDWLGSDTKFFAYGDPAEERIDFARAMAAKAIAAIGLEVTDLRAALGVDTPGYGPLLGDPSRVPHDAQRTVRDLPAGGAGELLVLESETGSGKTEAAVMRFFKLFHAGLVDGMYFALPTRSAATQLHARLHGIVERVFGSDRVEVILAVPGYLGAGGAKGSRLPGFEVLWNDNPTEEVRHRRWAAENAKRYLAGTIVVGTIDQVLLAAIQVPHAHMRSTALLRSLLVVDEVHASDAYMTTLLEAVLAQHRAAGGHTLLMSATLGASARARLMGHTPPLPLELAEKHPYPVIAIKDGAGPLAEHPVENAGLPKVVEFRAVEWISDPARIVAEAVAFARKGLRVLIVRNTVRDAVATQRALENTIAADDPVLFRCAGVPSLHHARFAREDRSALDAALEERFGRGASGGGRIVVATQTVQQSLDIDADVLLSDLCPMDVLLQRVGRVWRHPTRPRPAGIERGSVIVLVPDVAFATFLADNGRVRASHGFGTVYPDLRVLEATLRLIRSNDLLAIPAMNRTLVERATHPEALDAIANELGVPWQRHGQQVLGQTLGQRNIGHSNVIPWQKEFVDASDEWWGFASGDEIRKIVTRLGASDRRVDLGRRCRGPFGSMVHEMNIPGWMAVGVGEDEECAINVREQQDAIRFEWGNRTWIYDRLGLRRDQDVEFAAEE